MSESRKWDGLDLLHWLGLTLSSAAGISIGIGLGRLIQGVLR